MSSCSDHATNGWVYLGIWDDLPPGPDVCGVEVEHDVDEEDDVNNGVYHQQTRSIYNLSHNKRIFFFSNLLLSGAGGNNWKIWRVIILLSSLWQKISPTPPGISYSEFSQFHVKNTSSSLGWKMVNVFAIFGVFIEKYSYWLIKFRCRQKFVTIYSELNLN